MPMFYFPFLGYSLYISLNPKMMIKRNKKGLKGRQILAQGKRRRSVALGWETGRRIVRTISIIKEYFLFRTKGMISILRQMMSLNSVRNRLLALFIEFSRTVLLLHFIPRAAFRFVPPETLPWADIFRTFKPEKKSGIDLCINIPLLWRG
jgi:hypothetical protein